MNTEHIKLKNLQLLRTVRKFAVRKRATITEEQSAFKAYANALHHLKIFI